MSDRRHSKVRLGVFVLLSAGVLLAMGCETPSDAKPTEAPAASRPAKLPPGFDKVFITPDSDRDQHGNPVVTRNGSKMDARTGYPYEIWLRQPRIEFVFVPAGEFMMGSSISAEDVARRYGGKAGWFTDEHPQHKVRITKPFYMAKYETTNGQYRLFKSGHDSRDYKGHSLNGDTQPVVYVSWNDATAFCQWVTGQTRVEVTLPTEAQWEYACRAGTTGIWYWGASESNAGQYANVADRTVKRELTDWTIFDTDDGHAVAASVGKFRPNAFGLHGMLGNVWEWCQDGKRSYTSSAQVDPRGPDTGARVLRGGSWLVPPRHARSAHRYDNDPPNTNNREGFRVCVCVSSQ